jgi:hypothetical protein
MKPKYVSKPSKLRYSYIVSIRNFMRQFMRKDTYNLMDICRTFIKHGHTSTPIRKKKRIQEYTKTN